MNLKYFVYSIILLFIFGFMGSTTAYSAFVFPSGGNDGNYRCQNSTHYILWSPHEFKTDTGFVDILLWNGESSTYTIIAENVPDSLEAYTWNISVNHPTGDNFRVRVQRTGNPEYYHMSTNFFSIYEQSSSTGPLSVSYEIEDKKEIIVYPNPAPLHFRVRWNTDDAQTMRLLSAAGHQITAFSVKGLHDHLFSTECLAPGIYFIEIIFADGNRETTKVVVQK